MQTADPLIRTKLRPPFIRAGLVARPRLQQQVAQGLRCPLTLITAPAGFGKTTLVASCVAGRDRELPVRAAWLSLDKDDNQAERFLRYLVAALREADPEMGREAAQIMAVQQPPPAAAVLTRLINDLDAVDGDIVLVLDDYHFISSPAVHEHVAFLLEHCPKPFHLVIVTRSDPPLPLTRLRARGQMVEFRAADLRFTPAEAAQFLNEVMGLGLDSRSIGVLAERTEGWITGLQMAALSIRDRQDIRGFIEAFSGTNRYILDYLLEEVLASQPPEIQRFLLFTSILERLSAPLCEAVLNVETLAGLGKDKTSAGTQPTSQQNCQAILEYLELANLFLTPQEDAAGGASASWYRYHPLFADLLRAQLQKSGGDQAVIRLHLQASVWYEQNGSTLDAIYHASLAADDERIEHLIELNYTDMMNHGEMSSVRFWLGKLSKELILRRPWLSLYQAGSNAWFGQLDEASFWLNEVEKRIRSAGFPPAGAEAIVSYHAYLKSRVTAMQGDTSAAIALCRTAREHIPDDNLGLQIDYSITLGYEYFLHGDFEQAEQVLREMIQLGEQAGAKNNPVAGYAILARMRCYQGQLHDAHSLLQRAAQMIRDASGQYLGVNGLLEVEAAALSCEWNDLEAARIRLQRGLDFLPLWGKADDLALTYVTQSRIQLAQGSRTGAADTIEKAARLVQASGVFSEARAAVEGAQVRLWLAQGDRLAVDRWLAGLEKRFGSRDPFQYEDELAHITRARVCIAQDRLDEAVRLLARLEETARSSGRTGRLIEILILKALAARKMGETARAAGALLDCLARAEPEGYLRIFLDEGRPMQAELANLLGMAIPPSLRNYIIRLLAEFEAETQVTPAVQPAGPMPVPSELQPAKTMLVEAEDRSAKTHLIDPLSPRELEVLRLLAQGRTNQDIALQLIISIGTVKAHAANIYRKLDAANRTEAVARARELGILP